MKKAILLLLPLMLVSCNKHSDNTASSSSHEDITEEVLFERFINKLNSLEGTIKTANVTTDRTISYLTTGGDFFEMKTKTVETKEKYTRNESYLVDSTGNESYLNDDGTASSQSNFHSQLYNDSNYLYKIVKYTDPSFDDIASKYKMEGSDVESFYAMGFKTETKVNLDTINRIKEDKDHYEYFYDNFEGNIINNELEFSYQLNTYEIEKGKRYLAETFSYTYVLSISNNACSSYSLNYKYDVYAGGIVAQKMEVNLTSSITQGTLSKYKGAIIS